MLTRSRPKKRYSRVRLAVLAVLFVVLLLSTITVWYVNVVRADEEILEADAIEASRSAVSWSSVDSVDKSIWDDVYYVVTGTDDAGVTQMAWVDGETKQVIVTAASDGVTKADIRQNIKQQYPEAEIVRLVPGIKDEELVWQAFVHRKDETGNYRYYYHFYHFSDGTPTGDIYSMPNK